MKTLKTKPCLTDMVAEATAPKKLGSKLKSFGNKKTGRKRAAYND